MEVDETEPRVPIVNATTYTEIEGKRRKVMKNCGDSNQHINCENLNPTILNFPLSYLTDDHIIQALLDVSEDDELFVKIWLTYCNNTPIKNKLRKVYHDHCYSDIPNRDCIGVNNVEFCDKTIESSETVKSSKVTESTTSGYDIDSQSESNYQYSWDTERTIFSSDIIIESVELLDPINCLEMSESYSSQLDIDSQSESSLYDYVDPNEPMSSDMETEPEELSDPIECSDFTESHDRKSDFYCSNESRLWNRYVCKKTNSSLLPPNNKSEHSSTQYIILPPTSQFVQ